MSCRQKSFSTVPWLKMCIKWYAINIHIHSHTHPQNERDRKTDMIRFNTKQSEKVRENHFTLDLWVNAVVAALATAAAAAMHKYHFQIKYYLNWTFIISFVLRFYLLSKLFVYWIPMILHSVKCILIINQSTFHLMPKQLGLKMWKKKPHDHRKWIKLQSIHNILSTMDLFQFIKWAIEELCLSSDMLGKNTSSFCYALYNRMKKDIELDSVINI